MSFTNILSIYDNKCFVVITAYLLQKFLKGDFKADDIFLLYYFFDNLL